MPKTLSELMRDFPPQVLARYDFSNAKYVDSTMPIMGIVCPRHGVFKQYAGQLRKGGSGCPACGDEVRRAKQRLSLDEFVARANEAHGGKYSYEKSVLVNTATKLTVTCPDHGDFDITPNNHLKNGSGDGRARGCPKCGALKRGHRLDIKGSARATADSKLAKFGVNFVEEARAIHGDKYDYSETVYQGRRTKLTIRCPEHGPFIQTAMNHLGRTQGCPECSHHLSKGEAEIFDFISIFATPESRNRALLGGKELDIYVPAHKLAIEYCGEYWHGARNAEEEPVYRVRHIEKFKNCQEQGIRLLTIYESEWRSRSKQYKRLIRNALGKSRGSVMARKCDLRRIGHAPASIFFETYHPQGGGGFGEHYGLFHGDKLIACMRFTLGANDRGPNHDRVWTLSRYATRVAVPGGGSRLLAAFRDDHPGVEIKSFSDNRFFTGAFYEQLGFRMEGESAPDYQVYHIKTGLLTKPSWQRKNIPARIRDIGVDEQFDPETDPRSEREMTYLLGARRLFDCGKRRWVLAP